MDDVGEFYNGWAGEYDALYSDWPSVVRHSGAALAHVLAACGVAPGSTVLDCTCGIGTQVIGLALHGYGADRPRATPIAVSGEGPTRRASFQRWEWDEDGRAYTMERVTLTASSADGAGSDWTMRTSRTRLRPASRDRHQPR